MSIYVEPLPDHGEEASSLQQNEDDDDIEDNNNEVSVKEQEDEDTITSANNGEEKDEEDEVKEDEEFFQTADDTSYKSYKAYNTYQPHQPMTMYTLTSRSFVNGKQVNHDEPISLKKRSDIWKLHYKLRETDISPEDATIMYNRMRKRQAQVYNREGKLQRSFVNTFKSISDRGLKFEEKKTKN